MTQSCVLAFQRGFGLKDDGIVNVAGPTWMALSGKPALPTVRPGSQGTYVAVLQRALNRLHGAGLADDGVYTTAAQSPTGDAIRAWQTAEQQEVDGVCGHVTWATVERRASDGGYVIV